jgi:aspartate aminotransferase
VKVVGDNYTFSCAASNKIGCIVSKNKELIATAMKFAQARLSPPTFAQVANEAALDLLKAILIT